MPFLFLLRYFLLRFRSSLSLFLFFSFFGWLVLVVPTNRSSRRRIDVMITAYFSIAGLCFIAVLSLCFVTVRQEARRFPGFNNTGHLYHFAVSIISVTLVRRKMRHFCNAMQRTNDTRRNLLLCQSSTKLICFFSFFIFLCLIDGDGMG